MTEPNQRTFVIKSTVSDAVAAPISDAATDPSMIEGRKLFQINSLGPKYELPAKTHIPRTIISGLAASLNPRAAADFVLYFTKSSFEQIQQHIGWGRHTLDNAVEQGGLLLGNAFVDPDRTRVFAIARHAIAGAKARGSGAYLNMTHETWAEMLARVDAITDADPESALQIIGWYHTHPNSLDVFMSGTDQNTQRTFFPFEWQFAVVLNPHKELWRVYQGAASAQCHGFVVDEEVKETIESERIPQLVETDPTPSRRDHVSDAPQLPTAHKLGSLALPHDLRRVLFIAFIVYSLVATIFAFRLWHQGNRLKRHKVRLERNILAAAPKHEPAKGQTHLAAIQKIVKDWRSELAAKGLQDQRTLLEAEKAIAGLSTAVIPDATPLNFWVNPLQLPSPIGDTLVPFAPTDSPSPAAEGPITKPVTPHGN